MHPKRTEGADIRNGISADQIAAAEIGKDTALPSLELAIDLNFLGGQCENSYACAYMNTLSWRTATTPLPTENNPRIVFERLFGDGGSPEQRLARARENRSILDSVMADLDRLQKSLGPGDRTKVDDYVDAVREVERRIQGVEQRSASDLPDLNQPSGIPERFDEHVKLMYELQWLAYRADITRVVTFMLGRELNFRTYPEIGITEGHHGLSHHQDNPNQLAKYAKLNTYQAELFSWFLEKLKSTPEGDGTLLDHSLFLYGAGLSNPEPPRALRSAARPRWRRGRPAQRRPPRRLQAGDADDEPAAVDARQGRRAAGQAGRQHRAPGNAVGSVMQSTSSFATSDVADVPDACLGRWALVSWEFRRGQRPRHRGAKLVGRRCQDGRLRPAFVRCSRRRRTSMPRPRMA